MPSVTISKIVKEPGGRILVYCGKHCREFGSLAQMQAAVRAALTRDDLIDLALRLMMERQPALGNPSAFEGRSVNVDFTAANWGTVT